MDILCEKSFRINFDKLLHNEAVKFVQKVRLYNIVPKNTDGTPMLLETVFEMFPNTEVFEMYL